MKSIGLQYLVGIDGVSLWMVLLTTFLFPLSVLASWTVKKNVRLYMASMLVLETAVLGSFVALDLLLFFVFFEALLVPMYLIIGGWGGERRIYAAVKFFLYTMAGSAFLLVGILFLYSRSAGPVGHGTFDIQQLTSVAGSLPASTARWLFLAFFVAFAVKVPLFPLHTWLPDAHTEAPTAGSVLLAGVLLKVGAYGLIRFNLQLFPDASKYFASAVSILAVIGIIYGAVVALIQTDIKRLVAYSSVSHLGFVVLGIFAFTEPGGDRRRPADGEPRPVDRRAVPAGRDGLRANAYARSGQDGGPRRRHAVAHRRVPVRGRSRPSGLPGLNNFVGEFLVILGSFAVNRWFGALAAVAVVLAAIYLLWSYQRMAYGPDPRGALAAARREPPRGAGPGAGPGAAARLRRLPEAPDRSDRPDGEGRGRARRPRSPHRRRRDGRRAGERSRCLMPTPKLEFAPILPELFLCGVAIVGLLYEAMAPKAERRWHLALAIPGWSPPRSRRSRSGTGRGIAR